jgi:prepilin signal peptidase PulO-like enzyme (type II secretory pathway)
MIIAVLILLGLCFGSFTNALVWRLHEQSLPKKKRKASDKDLSISKGRSMCVNCGHTLQAPDLVPVLSWLALRGRCRYCRKTISWQYPLVEAVTAALFVISYVFWPEQLSGWETAGFGLWLVSLTGFMALIIYDLRWMLLPNKIIFPLYGVAAAFVLTQIAGESSLRPLLEAAFGVLVGGGLFYLLFQISDGRWIGGGDVKLGFLLGALLSDPLQAGLMLFVASLTATIVTVPLMLGGRISKKTRIPFGPFLIAAAVVVQLFGKAVTDWYVAHFINLQ